MRALGRWSLRFALLTAVALGLAGSLPASRALLPEANAATPADTAGPSLRGALPVPALWQAYKARFVTPEGRIVDDLNGNVSHSEGQGYGLLLALAADDGETFRRIWTWTRGNLYLRRDGLASWRWQPGPTPNVRDPNNATDGDLLIAWALAEAGEAWNEPAYTLAARHIARAVFTETVIETRFGPTLLPAVSGFRAADRRDGPVVNPSYWVFPALARLDRLMPDLDWGGVARAGERIIVEASAAPAGLPPEWAALAGDRVRPADGFPAIFGYNAVRVPLYLSWASGFRRERLAPYMARWSATPTSEMHLVELGGGNDLERFAEPGYRAVAALVACELEGTRIPDDLRGAEVDHYFPTTLRALALVAVNTRHPTCW